MKTIAEIVSWLKTADHIRTILVEVESVLVGGGQSATFYLANRPFVTSSSDTPANTSYDPCLVGGISFSESLSLDSSVSIGYGDLEVDNMDGSKDSWLNYVWTNRSIKIYIGDPTWSRNDYTMIFSGLVSDVASRSRSSLNLVLVDKLQKLNNPISEVLLASNELASDTLIPVSFGECFNVSPLVADSSTLTYQVHTGVIEDIIEVRDNGAPVSFTKDLANGKFSLTQSPYGQITCSVQGAKTSGVYTNTIPEIIKTIVKNYGPSNSRLTDADIDLANFANFNTLYSYPVGVYCTSRENMLEVCNELAASIGAQVTFSNLGLLKLVRLDLAGTGTTYTVEPSDVESKSLTVGEKSVVRAATKLGYAKNWTPQTSGLAAGVNPASVPLFNTEYLFETAENPTTATNYSITTEPQSENTLLITTDGAQAEAVRRNALFSTPRTTYIMTAYPPYLFVNLGDNINLSNPRFGLGATKSGIVVSIDKDWITGRVSLGVLV
jgi:hypothetical protein